MNIFTRNRIPAQGPPQTFEEQIINQTFNQQNKYKKVCSKDFKIFISSKSYKRNDRKKDNLWSLFR